MAANFLDVELDREDITMLKFTRFYSILTPNIIKRKPGSLHYKIRPIKIEEIPKLIELKRKQGTQDVASSFYTWYKLDPEGIGVAVTNDGQIIGSLAVLKFHEVLYFGSFFYVANEYRKSGVGSEIYNNRYCHAKYQNIGINAVPELSDFFRKLLCVHEDRWVMNIYESFSKVKPEFLSSDIPNNVEIHPFQKSHLPYMSAYDTQLMGFQRNFLEWSCQENGSITLVALKKAAGTTECVGFGTIKESVVETGRVGPLYADDSQVAEALLKKLIMSMPNVRGFASMSLSTNEGMNQLMRKIGCPKTKHYDRIYTKERVEVNSSKIYAVFDLNAVPF